MKLLKYTVLFAGMATLMAATYDDAYGFKRVVKVGDVVKSKVNGQLQLMGQDAEYNAVSSEKITEVKPNGDYVIEVTQSDGKVKFGGQEQDIPSQAPTLMTYNANGEIIDIKGPEGTDANGFRTANLGIISVPDAAKKIGESWTYTAKDNSKTGAVAFTAEYKVLSLEDIGTHHTVKISANVKETAGAEPASNVSSVWLDTTDFSIVKQEQQMTNVPIPGAPGPISGKFNTTRDGK